MTLSNIFNWTFRANSQAPKPETEGLALRVYATVAIPFLIFGFILALIPVFYSFTASTQTSGGMSDMRESPLVGSVRKRQIKRRKAKKGRKPRLTKAQILQEVNRKWYEMYGSENSDCEENNDLGTVPFGSVEITGVKKVSFRDIIKDVYLIESKEEMKRLEHLQKLGYDVTIGIHQTSARDIARELEPAQKFAYFKDNGVISAPLLFPFLNSPIDEKEASDVSPWVVKKWRNASDLEMEDSKKFNSEVLSNHILDGEDRLRNIPQFTETSV